MLLKTRFYRPPLRANTVMRERLLHQLDAATGGSLVLISAPAGYGKTTLVTQWLHQRPHGFAWLSLGAEHNVLEVFWQYAILSLQQIQPQLGHEVQQIWLDSPRRNYASVVISLLNDLDALAERNQSDDPITLVLDDFHWIKDEQLLTLLNTFLDHLPSSLRVVMTARDHPDLKLPQRRASGQLVPLSVEALRFTDQEAADFFLNTMLVPEAAPHAKALGAKTEGWIAGMQLVALNLKQHRLEPSAFLDSPALDRHISDYLLAEVFSGCSDDIKAFLLLSALPGRFCAGLCNALCQRRDSMDVITALERGDLFLVALDNHRAWYRYHDLFRQFLLQQTAAWDDARRLSACERALTWLEAQGYYDDAIELCLQQQVWAEAQRLLQSDWVQQAAAGQTLQHWRAQMPPEFQANDGQHDRAVEPVPKTAPEPVTAEMVLRAPHREEHGVANEPVEPLTRREQAVLELIAQGLSNKEIADTLHISPNTLKVHIRNLYGKMGVENRTQALLKLHSP